VAYLDTSFGTALAGVAFRSPFTVLFALGLVSAGLGWGRPGIAGALAVFAAVCVHQAVLLLDSANAAGPGWLASRYLYRWRHVRTDRLTSVARVGAGFWFKDADGGRALLALRRRGALDVLAVVRDDVLRARDGGLPLPADLRTLLEPPVPQH
jgi:hypothetical protein